MVNNSLEVIKELENMFNNDQDSTISCKLKIIEYYIELSYVQGMAIPELINKIKCTSELHRFKPSRIETIINAYIHSQNNSGYIQPIGKDLFLERFLSRYPTPLMIQLSENDWTVNSLKKCITAKYNCIITKDTIRKKLSKHHYFFHDKIKLFLDQSIPIYYIQLHKNPFPIRKNRIEHPRSVRYFSLTWFIWGYRINQDIDIVYKEEPFSCINHEPGETFLNLDYLFQIPETPGLFLFDDTPYVREVIPKYYNYLCKNKIHPSYEFYILPDSHFTTANFLMNRYLELVIGLIRPIITCSVPIFSKSFSSLLPQFTDLLKDMKEDAINDFLFDYFIEKGNIASPKLLKV